MNRATYGALVTLFAELTDCAAVWKSGLKGWNMRESTIVAGWKAEGRAEGLVQGEQRALLTVLRQKFGTKDHRAVTLTSATYDPGAQRPATDAPCGRVDRAKGGDRREVAGRFFALQGRDVRAQGRAAHPGWGGVAPVVCLSFRNMSVR
jgi:hypothetical protein